VCRLVAMEASGRSLGETPPVGVGHGLGTVPGSDLGDEVVDVDLDGAFTDEALGDLAVRES
jgi:hypothetical protein